MIKLGFYVTLALIVAMGAVWFANHPGLVILTWQGWQASMSVAVLWLLIFLYTALWGILFRCYFWFRVDNPLKSPNRLKRRRDKGLAELDLGWSALAIEDRQAALKHAKKAHNLLPDDHGPLRLLLKVAPDVEKYLVRLEDEPGSSRVALKYRLDRKLEAEEYRSALSILEEMQQLTPENSWINQKYFGILTRLGEWTAAMKQLDKLVKIKAITKNDYKHFRAVICYSQALEADLAGDKAAAHACARKALKYDPALLPAQGLLKRHTPRDKDNKTAITATRWACGVCGKSQDKYAALCPKCHSFGQMSAG